MEGSTVGDDDILLSLNLVLNLWDGGNFFFLWIIYRVVGWREMLLLKGFYLEDD